MPLCIRNRLLGSTRRLIACTLEEVVDFVAVGSGLGEDPAQACQHPLHWAGFLPSLFDVRFMACESGVAVLLQGCADHQRYAVAIRVEGSVQIALPGYRGFSGMPLVDLEGEAAMA